MKTYSILFLLFAFALTSCGTVNVRYDYDKNINFNTYKTYNFHQKGIEKLELNDLDKRRIISSIETQLAAKGFTKSDNPELLINVLANSKEKINIDNGGYYGGYYGPYWAGNSRVYQYTSGTIIIDVIDNHKNILVWQGSGSGLDVSNLGAKDENISKAVAEILAKFPPPAKK